MCLIGQRLMAVILLCGFLYATELRKQFTSYNVISEFEVLY